MNDEGRVSVLTSKRERIAKTVLWVLVAAGAAAMAFARLRDATGDPTHGTDLETFLTAARAAARGGSVYEATGYVYLPFVAWMLVPFAALPAETVFAAWTTLSLAAALGAVAALTATLWSGLRPWQRPVVAGVAGVTLLYNAVFSLELWLGQNDTLILLLTSLAVLFATFRHSHLSGAMVGLGAVLKTWPGGLGLWLLRRGAPDPLRGLSVAAATGVAALLIVVAVAGPGELAAWVQRTLAFSSQQLVTYSVWGVGRQAFADAEVMTPVVDDPMLGSVIAWALAAIVVALIIVALRWPGTDSLAMWNIAAGLVMLIPVSHLWYRLLMLPLVWVWFATLVRRPRDLWAWVTAAVAVLFWWTTFRLQPIDNQFTDNTAQYLLVMGTGLAMLAVSVAAAAAGDVRTAATPPRRSRASGR